MCDIECYCQCDFPEVTICNEAGFMNTRVKAKPFGRKLAGRCRRRGLPQDLKVPDTAAPGCATSRALSMRRGEAKRVDPRGRSLPALIWSRGADRVPKLRQQTFETAIIERYRRRESSVEEALIEMSYGQKTEPVEKAVNCAASVAGPEGTR
jgi:hypothetical protein